MFKPNHYYVVIHRDFKIIRPIKCIIKVYSGSQTGKSWEIKIIKIIESDEENTFTEGLTTSWYEEWCEILAEFNRIPNESELLAYVL